MMQANTRNRKQQTKTRNKIKTKLTHGCIKINSMVELT